jgi:hypothetical protein
MKSERRPFASVVRLILIFVLLASMALIGQRISMQLYQLGLLVLVVATFSQIAFGNIPPEANFARSVRLYAIYMGITVAIFVIAIVVAPLLVSLGR